MNYLITSSFDDLAKQLDIKTLAGRRALELAIQNVQTLDKKQQDYGPRNITDFGELGVLVRANDKLARLKNLMQNGVDVKFESVMDSWLDLSNYSLIGAMLHKDIWPDTLEYLD